MVAHENLFLEGKLPGGRYTMHMISIKRFAIQIVVQLLQDVMSALGSDIGVISCSEGQPRPEAAKALLGDCNVKTSFGQVATCILSI